MGEAMDEIERCVRDVLVSLPPSGGIAEAKRRIEILFANADKQTGRHTAAAQQLNDQLGMALNSTGSPAKRQSLTDVIAWLRRDHFG
jgi:hypothetical protein